MNYQSSVFRTLQGQPAPSNSSETSFTSLSVLPEEAQVEYWRNYEEEQRLKEQNFPQYQQQLRQIEQQISWLKIGQEYQRKYDVKGAESPEFLPPIPPSHSTPLYTQYQPLVVPSDHPTITPNSSPPQIPPLQPRAICPQQVHPYYQTNNKSPQTTLSPPVLHPSIQPPIQQSHQLMHQSANSQHHQKQNFQTQSSPVQSGSTNLPYALYSTSMTMTSTTTTTSTITAIPTIAEIPNKAKVFTDPQALRPNSTNSWQVIVPPEPSPLATHFSLQNSNIHTSSNSLMVTKFGNLIDVDSVNLGQLASLALSSGIPSEKRAITWQLLLGYLPQSRASRSLFLKQQRLDYLKLLSKHWRGEILGRDGRILGNYEEYQSKSSKNPNEPAISKDDFQVYHSVAIDATRTLPTEFTKLFSDVKISETLERIMFVWSQENKDVGYFQGLADIVVPFLLVYLTSCFGPLSDCFGEYEKNTTISSIDACTYLPAVEADAFWSLSILMNNLRQDHPLNSSAVHAEAMMSEFFIIMEKVDPTLMKHLNDVGLELVCFALRWMLCLMTREFTPKNVITLWDTYISEKQGFSKFHIYVCVAFMSELSPALLETNDLGICMDIVLKPPTRFLEQTNISNLVQKGRNFREKFPL